MLIERHAHEGEKSPHRKIINQSINQSTTDFSVLPSIQSKFQKRKRRGTDRMFDKNGRILNDRTTFQLTLQGQTLKIQTLTKIPLSS